MKKIICPECENNIIILNQEYLFVCSNCGLVLGADNIMGDSGSNFLSRQQYPRDITLKQLSTLRWEDGRGFKRTLFLLDRFNGSLYETTKRSINLIRRISCFLEIPEIILKEAEYEIIKKIYRKGKRSSYQITAAALIIAARRHNRYLPLNDVIKTFNLFGVRLNPTSLMRTLELWGHEYIPGCYDVKQLIDLYISKIKTYDIIVKRISRRFPPMVYLKAVQEIANIFADYFEETLAPHFMHNRVFVARLIYNAEKLLSRTLSIPHSIQIKDLNEIIKPPNKTSITHSKKYVRNQIKRIMAQKRTEIIQIIDNLKIGGL